MLTCDGVQVESASSFQGKDTKVTVHGSNRTNRGGGKKFPVGAATYLLTEKKTREPPDILLGEKFDIFPAISADADVLWTSLGRGHA